ncbi:hypothetical protein K493DRAFT_310494 [Basidiobolus meristosporus CBS 931.73]|uniref:Uncharacterized protein n=1 Tax=Basidiobolus meristosporus CBS 931.73 TaxID=1314790 RepID=A0A1Y1Z8G0_9FUNG|nr:hypothetical protein K493DRAFT_310494 [Basidiobolus meristosporus CBS 931.73]|eukprot:ORY06548.1 hypothetical protein K493DRAFT_310494 [Basidiobolus meristosporus CBS 931.73]
MRTISDKHMDNMSTLKKRLSSLFLNAESKKVDLHIESRTRVKPTFSPSSLLKLIKGATKSKSTTKGVYEIDEEEGADLPQLCDITLHQTEYLFRSEFSPLKQVYLNSMKKLQNSKERPLHQLLLIHQTILKVNSTAFATGVHPLLLHRRLSERTILPKTVNRNSPVSGRHPLATCFKASNSVPPPPYDNNSIDIQELEPPRYNEPTRCKDEIPTSHCSQALQQIC